MECRIIEVEQGSDEWLDLRRTRITCSRLADVMSTPKKCGKCGGSGKIRTLACPDCEGAGGFETKRYRQYRKEKVLELLGNKEVEENPEWAQHGRELEPRALRGYQWKFEQRVEHNIFLIHKEYDWLGGSPDFMHLPEYNEGGEIKCRQLYKNYRKIREECERYEGTIRACPAPNRHQVQGNMWLTGLPRWWFVNYYLGDDLQGGEVQKLHRVQVPRDNDLIRAMEIRCIEFMKDCYERAELEYESR